MALRSKLKRVQLGSKAQQKAAAYSKKPTQTATQYAKQQAAKPDPYAFHPSGMAGSGQHGASIYGPQQAPQAYGPQPTPAQAQPGLGARAWQGVKDFASWSKGTQFKSEDVLNALSAYPALGAGLGLGAKGLKAAKTAVGRDFAGEVVKGAAKAWGKTLPTLSKVSPVQIAHLRELIAYGTAAEKKAAQSALNTMANKEVNRMIAARTIEKARISLDTLGRQAIESGTILVDKTKGIAQPVKTSFKWGISKADKAFNTKQSKLITKRVWNAVRGKKWPYAVAIVTLLAIKEVAQSKSTALWGEGEVGDSLTFFRKDALKKGLTNISQEFKEIYDETRDKSLWDNIKGWAPTKNVADVVEIKLKVTDVEQRALDKEDQMMALGISLGFDIKSLEDIQTRKEIEGEEIRTGASDIQTRKEEEGKTQRAWNDMNRKEQERAGDEMAEYYRQSEEIKQMNALQQQEFWREYQENKQAFWEDYRKKKEAPSQLGFGLL